MQCVFSGGPDKSSSPVSLGGDSRAKIVPRMRRVREPVKHEHERPRTLLEIGELQPVRVDEMDRISHGFGDNTPMPAPVTATAPAIGSRLTLGSGCSMPAFAARVLVTRSY